MSTRYPTTLPPVDLPHRWGFTGVDNGGDPDEGTAYSIHLILAASAAEAEQRVLSVIAYDYSDMRDDGYLEGCEATARPVGPGGLYEVRIAYRRMS